MPLRYLFGPVTKTFADQNLRGPVERGECQIFQEVGDFPIRWDDAWESIAARFPADWQPDYLVLYLPYRVIPQALWNCRLPTIGFASEWSLLWHHYRRLLPRCDLVFTDRLGVETFAKAGIAHVRYGCLLGCERLLLEEKPLIGPRPIDILFVGNFHPAVQKDRAPWLARLARLSDRYNVQIINGVFGAEYRRLLGQSRIVFNHSKHREWNLRVAEALATGALLFQEADNLEVPQVLKDRKECVFYNEENLETLLVYYLEHEDERRTIAQTDR